MPLSSNQFSLYLNVICPVTLVNSYGCRVEQSCLSEAISFIHLILIFKNLLNTMVFTRAQLETLCREELVEELIKCSNVTDQLKILTDWFDDFVGKYNKLQSELIISKNCNSSLVNRIINLERNALSNTQCIRREMLELNPVPHSMNNVDLEKKVCEGLSLTDTKVKPDDLDACHRIKKKDKVIIKFKNRKQRNNVVFKRKELNSKEDDLLALQFGRSCLLTTACVLKTRFSVINAGS